MKIPIGPDLTNACVQFMYFTTHVGAVITAAYTDSESGLWAAFAICAERDQYVKAKGRTLASRRLRFGQTRDTRTGRHRPAVWHTAWDSMRLPSAAEASGQRPFWRGAVCDIFNYQVPPEAKPRVLKEYQLR